METPGNTEAIPNTTQTEPSSDRPTAEGSGASGPNDRAWIRKAAMFLAGMGKLVYDIYMDNLSESAVLAFLGAMLVWAVGLLADQNQRISQKR